MVGILSIGISVKLVILSNITAASKADKILGTSYLA